MLKEVDILGVFIAPFVAYLAAALVLFWPVRMLLDRYAVQRWVWHRSLFDISIFTIFVCVIGLLFT